MRTILLIVSFLIIIFTFIIFYIGIYDEIYQELEKNKLWFSDSSFTKSLIFLFVSIFCSIYIFKHFSKKMKKLDSEEQYNSLEKNRMELIKNHKNFKSY